MKKICMFLLGTMLLSQHGQAQFKRYYWLNPMSVNYTLSYPTSSGEWMLAAARQERGAPNKNTIAVFKVDNAYNILDSRVIGRYWIGEEFDPNVNFEIHCIVESFNPTGHYIICGSMRTGTAIIGVVFVLDAGLHPQFMREYPEVRNFYSVYAQDGYFFACGQTQDGHGIVLRDNVVNAQPPPAAQAWITQVPWDYQKIRVVNSPGNGQFKGWYACHA
ncbi:MAG: hypothetical protein FWH36_02095 [Lentimicrobiaceae bacterium]|nr:hypothetical protein [Lentimicrobiaceae bacterium]